jgi:predicted TIM-barrel fold metal-dependent hydrolase
MRRPFFTLVVAAVLAIRSVAASAEEPVTVKHTRAELEAKWEARIRSFLARDVIPLVDLESSLRREDGERYLEDALTAMDAAGVALIAFDGYQAPKTDKEQAGYRWGYYVHEVVNAHPDRFILASNGGVNPNWIQGKDSFIAQTEEHVRGGQYPIMGEFEFRHYMSSHQCKQNLYHRDVNVALDGPNGHRLFKLAEATGVAFVIHNEPEDAALDGLEKMLKAYPKAKVINAHFGQVRHPEKQRRFTPELVRRLLGTYANLHYDISTGHPGRGYQCGTSLDTVIWQRDGGSQKAELDPAYKAILTEFSTRFVAGLDYGGGRLPLPQFIETRAANVRLIIRDLPADARRNIGYRNAWRLLTGREWKDATP